MPYTPEEYEKLKAAYKEALRQRKAILETAQKAHLRQKAEWHLLPNGSCPYSSRIQRRTYFAFLWSLPPPRLKNETSAPSSSEGVASPSEPKTLF